MPDIDYYMTKLREAKPLLDQAESGKRTLFQQLLIVSSTLTGIVVALSPSSIPQPHIRLALLGALLFLVCGILATGLVVYDRAIIQSRGYQAYLDEVHNAQQNGREVDQVFVKLPQRTSICEKTSLICLFLGLLLLACYAVLSVLA